MRDRLPCAVVGSNTVIMDREGNKFRGREYPWGSVNIEDKVQGFVCINKGRILKDDPYQGIRSYMFVIDVMNLIELDSETLIL